MFSDIKQCVVRVHARNACGWVEWVHGIRDWVKENEVCQSFNVFHYFSLTHTLLQNTGSRETDKRR